MNNQAETKQRSRVQPVILVVIRLLIGWHFLYEGISKMLIPDWTAAGYMENSRWIFSGFFHWLAASPLTLQIVDFVNMWGLTLFGLALILGIFIRTASIGGIVLLSLYYLANPPFVGIDFGIPAEGHYLFVNKNLIEIAALVLIVAFPTGRKFGLERLLRSWRNNRSGRKKAVETGHATEQGVTVTDLKMERRELLKYLSFIPIFGGFIYGSIKKYNWEKVNAVSGATIKVSDTRLKDLKGTLPMGEIKGHAISRLILGCNLIGGWSHSRDLIYVSSLFKAYNTEMKVFETLQLAEKAGINTMNVSVSQFPLINKYKRIFGSTLQTISQVHPTKEDLYGDIDKSIDAGVDLVQIQGNCCDWRVRAGEIDVLEKAIAHIKRQSYPAGMGAHSVQALQACEAAGIVPDFYMKTLHHDRYWSAHPRENRIPFSVDGEKSADHNQFHDNMFCLYPDETIAFIQNTTIPFIAFKVLAGGAIHPKEGFRFAFENGADFLCIGMFDYQVVDDINIALDILGDLGQRKRAWYA
jgi:uncharacterized membrane protein YphA (DoxX/SURF4 family)